MSQPPYPPSDQGPGPYPQYPQGGSPPGDNPQGGMPPNQYGQNQYGQNQYGQNQYGQNPYPQNPYPQGPAGQYGSAPTMQRPKEVDTSFYLWIASIVVSLLGTVLGFGQIDDARQQAIDQAAATDPTVDPAVIEGAITATIIGGLIVTLVLLALLVFFVFKMRAGRNWARITAAVLGGLYLLFGLIGLGGQPGLLLVTSAVSLLLLIGAIVMMFVKGANPWFQQRQAY